MKYMGAKRAMLENGLGDLLRKESADCRRVVDLFCGSASVSWFSARLVDKPVFATDLQEYAVVLARAVLNRIKPLDAKRILKDWIPEIKRTRSLFNNWKEAQALERASINTATWRKMAQDLCQVSSRNAGPVWRAYGGHYFSPTQALTLDATLISLPANHILRPVCLAATIMAASECVAAPGHTAQPFKATKTAAKFLREAWKRDPLNYLESALLKICPMYALRKGTAKIMDANAAARKLDKDDLVFVDPPYSGVHYSRFYHVLETVARGKCGDVFGSGRYPPPAERPVSMYSRKGESRLALTRLLDALAEVQCKVVVTFPSGVCSNGLSGDIVEGEARRRFRVQRKVIKTRFSTLGGNNTHRKARQISPEMILVLKS